MAKQEKAKTSPLGVAVFPEGKHPRELREEGKQLDPTLKSAYQAWLKGQDERTQEIAKRNPEKGAALFQNYVNGINPVDFAKMVGVAEKEEKGQDQYSNMADDARSTGEKREEKKDAEGK